MSKQQKITSKELHVLLLREMAEWLKDNPTVKDKLIRKVKRRLEEQK